jgi:hypothetical protein
VRHTARQLGIGRALLKVRALHAMTLPGAISLLRARQRDLPRILRAKPIPAGDGALEIHMLLHHQRILEGIWALYSFAHFAQQPCQFVVHSDGSLTATDSGYLHSILPGIRIIARSEADALVESRLAMLGYTNSIRFRKQLVFALKLFDPFFFGERASFVLLDSDVLFFRIPHELLDLGASNLYSPDNGVRYCIEPETLEMLLGKPCISYFNPGVVRSDRSVLDLYLIEQFLDRPEFWGTGSRPHYYGELTIWAMLLTLAGACALPQSYAITPTLQDALPTSGHFCGGGYPATWFYSRGIPRLALAFGV